MRILTIIGTQNKGNIRAITDLFLNEFKDKNNEFDEIKQISSKNNLT